MNAYYPIMRIPPLLVGMTALTIGCGGAADMSQTDSATYGSAQELIVEMKSFGLDCTGVEPIVKGDREWGQESALDVADCELEGETMNITIWKDSGQKKNWVGMGKSIGCEFAKAFGITEIDYVDGGLWTLGGVSNTLAEKIAAEFEGKAIQINCD